MIRWMHSGIGPLLTSCICVPLELLCGFLVGHLSGFLNGLLHSLNYFCCFYCFFIFMYFQYVDMPLPISVLSLFLWICLFTCQSLMTSEENTLRCVSEQIYEDVRLVLSAFHNYFLHLHFYDTRQEVTMCAARTRYGCYRKPLVAL